AVRHRHWFGEVRPAQGAQGRRRAARFVLKPPTARSVVIGEAFSLNLSPLVVDKIWGTLQTRTRGRQVGGADERGDRVVTASRCARRRLASPRRPAPCRSRP